LDEVAVEIHLSVVSNALNPLTTIHPWRFQNERDVTTICILLIIFDPLFPITRKPISIWPKSKLLMSLQMRMTFEIGRKKNPF
jgi:hypothetical protein